MTDLDHSSSIQRIVFGGLSIISYYLRAAYLNISLKVKLLTFKGHNPPEMISSLITILCTDDGDNSAV